MPQPRTHSPWPKYMNRFGLWLLLVAACLLLYGRYLFGQLPVGADNSLMYAPFYSLHWDGGPPLWDAFMLSGTPLYDNLQAALLYPLRWPFYFIADWRDYFGLFNFLHYLAALAGAALWMRSLGLRRAAALGGALVYAAGGHLAGRIINPTIFYGCCWLPWLLWGASGRERRHGWATTLGAAAILWVGSPHLMFYGAVGYALVFTILVIWPLRRPADRPVLTRLLLARALHLLLALLLAAPCLIPGVRRAQGSIRTGATTAANLADSVAWGELPPMLLGGTGAAIHPEYIDKCLYAGPVALALMLLLAFRPSTWRDRRWWAALALIAAGLFFALGKNAGVQYIMPWLPGFRNLAGAPRALILTVAGMALLTALGLHALPKRPPRLMGALLMLAGAALFMLFIARAANLPVPAAGDAPAWVWLRAWLVAPGALGFRLFPALDAAVGLLAAGAVLLLTGERERERLRLALLCALIFAQLLHFAPRVLPPTEPAAYFDPPPQVAFLQQVQRRDPTHPFRIAGYDPLRLHDAEFNNIHKIAFLTSNLATLYGLHDIQGFDPLIELDYLKLFLATTGRAPYNDPIHNLDIARPDTRLFDVLGVRFIVGHPYDRRVTTIPQTLLAQAPAQLVPAWDDPPTTGPITHWSFVSLVDGPLNLSPGTEIARLHVEAAEGVFEYPVRVGVETANLLTINVTQILKDPGFQAVANMVWSSHQPLPRLGYKLTEANWRGAIAFGRALTVRRIGWLLTDERVKFHVAAQACRLARPPAPADPWRLAFGDEDAVAPVFEYTRAKPLAAIVAYNSDTGASKHGLTVAARDLDGVATSTATVEWVERRTNSMRLRVKLGPDSAHETLALVLREKWVGDWDIFINGRRSEPSGIEVAPGGDLYNTPPAPFGLSRHLLGHALRPGDNDVRLVYRPLEFYGWLALALLAALAALAFELTRRMQKPRPPFKL